MCQNVQSVRHHGLIREKFFELWIAGDDIWVHNFAEKLFFSYRKIYFFPFLYAAAGDFEVFSQFFGLFRDLFVSPIN